jgi:hypothetical protein
MRFLHALVFCLEVKVPGYIDPLQALLSYCRHQLRNIPRNSGAGMEVGANLGLARSLDQRVMKFLNQKSDTAHPFESMFTENKLEQSSDFKDITLKPSSSGGAEMGPLAESGPSAEKVSVTVWKERIDRVIVCIVNRLLQTDDFISAINLLRETVASDSNNISLLNGMSFLSY